MKTRVSALILALALVFSVSSAAATPRSKNPISYQANLVVTSSGAACKFTINSSGVDVSVSGTISLYKNDQFLTSWSINSENFSKTYTRNITSGQYRMDYDITVVGPRGTDLITGSASYKY